MSTDARWLPDKAVPNLAEDVLRIVPPEQDNWWFVMERYDEPFAEAGSSPILEMFPLKMLSLKFEERESDTPSAERKTGAV
jgi:hypothetical protein